MTSPLRISPLVPLAPRNCFALRSACASLHPPPRGAHVVLMQRLQGTGVVMSGTLRILNLRLRPIVSADFLRNGLTFYEMQSGATECTLSALSSGEQQVLGRRRCAARLHRVPPLSMTRTASPEIPRRKQETQPPQNVPWRPRPQRPQNLTSPSLVQWPRELRRLSHAEDQCAGDAQRFHRSPHQHRAKRRAVPRMTFVRFDSPFPAAARRTPGSFD